MDQLKGRCSHEVFTQGVHKNGLIKVVHTRLAVDPTKAFELPSDSELTLLASKMTFRVIQSYSKTKGETVICQKFLPKVLCV